MAVSGMDKTKKIACLVFIMVCLGGAALTYSMMSDNSRPQTPQSKAAESKEQTIQSAIQEEQSKQPKAPPVPAPPPGAHRGPMAPPK